MSGETSGPSENGGAPDRDRVRPISARPGPRTEEPASGHPAGPRSQNGSAGGHGRPQPPQQPRDRRPPEPKAEAPAPETPPLESPPVRFSDRGVEWVVRAVGQGSSGYGSGGAAPL